MTENGTALAMNLLGSRCFPVGWGGRIRLLSTASATRSRYTSVKWVPAYRWNAQLFREYSAIRSAIRSPSVIAPTAVLSDWPPKSVQHHQPLDAIVGTPGPTQSILVRYVEPSSGKPCAVAKVMVSRGDFASERIEAESNALQDPRVCWLVPRHREVGIVDGHHYLVTDFVSGPSISPRRGIQKAAEALGFQKQNAEIVGIQEHPWIQRALQRVPWLKKECLVGRFAITRTHGDFAPWNILKQRGGDLTLIDWEFSEPDGVAGVDLVHYLLVTKQLLGRQDPRTAVRTTAAELHDLEGVNSDEARTLMALAAASVLMRDPHLEPENANHFWCRVIELCQYQSEKTIAF